MKHGINPSFNELLQEVNQGKYAAFRQYLIQNNMQTIDLSGGKAKGINLVQLGKALQGTNVTTLNLGSNDLGSYVVALAKSLQGSKVINLDLRLNDIDAMTAIELSQNLKGTKVKNLCLRANNIGYRAAEVVQALAETEVNSLDLSACKIRAGAEALIQALKGVNINKLYLAGNPFEKDFMVSGNELKYIPDTMLYETDLQLDRDCDNLLLKRALENNKKKIQERVLPYYVACLNQLPIAEKLKYFNSSNLNKNSSIAEQHQFASGIFLMSHKDVQDTMLGYLPGMNAQTADKFQLLAKQQHPAGLKVDTENTKVARPKQ